MKIEVPDSIRIVMPKDREFQWAAMSIIQKWINNYDGRMEKNDASSGRAKYVLRYELDIPTEDMTIFLKAGLHLQHSSRKLEAHPDMVIDLCDDRLNRWKDSGKHVNQVAGYMCGEEAIALPLIRRVHPGLGGKWGTFDKWFDGVCGAMLVTADELMASQDGEWEGIVGRANWRMYLASAMMLPTIELCPNTRNKRWLSKFANLGYRALYADDLGGEELIGRITDAQESIRTMLRSKVEAKCFPVPAQTVG